MTENMSYNWHEGTVTPRRILEKDRVWRGQIQKVFGLTRDPLILASLVPLDVLAVCVELGLPRAPCSN